MAFNPAGIFSLIATYFAEPGTTIRTEQHNPVFEDVAAALSQVLVRDGRAPMVGPLNMNGFAITGVSPGSTPSSVATVSQAMPIGAVIDFAGANAPAGWMLCYGQAISRSVYADLFSKIGTTFGSGDGSTTFNLPDCRGRVAAGKDNMGGSAASRLTGGSPGVNGSTLGASGGEQTQTLVQSQLPAVRPTFSGASATVNVTTLRSDLVFGTVAVADGGGGGGPVGVLTVSSRENNAAQSRGTFTPDGTISLLGSGAPHNNVQPTIILNKIIRVSYDG